MSHNIIPATKHMILLGAASKNILLLHVQDLHIADSAAYVQAFEMVVDLKSHFFALKFVLLENTGALLELDSEVQSDLLHAHGSLFYALLEVKQLAAAY